MNCRENILDCALNIIEKKGYNEFTIPEIIQAMKDTGTNYKESTIRTHVTSRMCANAPQNHLIKYADFERIQRGLYKIKK